VRAKRKPGGLRYCVLSSLLMRHWPWILTLVVSALAPAQVTYSKEISRSFQAKCQQCHRDGDIAPFAINRYDDAVTWSDDIARVLNDRTMPPWKPVDGFGEFRDSYPTHR